MLQPPPGQQNLVNGGSAAARLHAAGVQLPGGVGALGGGVPLPPMHGDGLTVEQQRRLQNGGGPDGGGGGGGMGGNGFAAPGDPLGAFDGK